MTSSDLKMGNAGVNFFQISVIAIVPFDLEGPTFVYGNMWDERRHAPVSGRNPVSHKFWGTHTYAHTV